MLLDSKNTEYRKERGVLFEFFVFEIKQMQQIRFLELNYLILLLLLHRPLLQRRIKLCIRLVVDGEIEARRGKAACSTGSGWCDTIRLDVVGATEGPVACQIGEIAAPRDKAASSVRW